MPCAVCCPGGIAAVKRGSQSLKWARCLRNLTRPRLLSKNPRCLDRRSGSTKANTIAASTDIVCVSAELNIPSVLVAAGPPLAARDAA